MKKKLASLAAAILMTMATIGPLVSCAYAAKEVVPFSYTAAGKLIKMAEVDVKWTPDYSTRIARGTWRLTNYNGPLGTGTMYSEAIISITHYDNLTVGYTTYHGQGNYRILYNITAGPYGVGTLEGVSQQEWDYDYQRTVKNMIWGNGTFQHGTGDFERVRMVYSFAQATYSGEIIRP